MTGTIYQTEEAALSGILGESLQELAKRSLKGKHVRIHRNYMMAIQPETIFRELIRSGKISEECITTRKSGIRFVYRFTEEGFQWLAKFLGAADVRVIEN